MAKMTMIVGVLESTDKQAAKFGAVTTLISQFTENKDGFELVQQIGGTTTVIGTILEMTTPLRDSTPIFSIPTNTFAGTVTLLKIVADIKEGHAVNAGDVISLLGNAAGIALPIAVLVGASAPVVGVIYTISTVVTVLGIIDFANSDFINGIRKGFLDKVWNNNFRDNPSATYSDYYIAPDATLASREEITLTYKDQVVSCQWNPEEKVVVCPPIVVRVSKEEDWDSKTIRPNSRGSNSRGSNIMHREPPSSRRFGPWHAPTWSRPKPEPIGRVRVEPPRFIRARCSPHFRSSDPSCNK